MNEEKFNIWLRNQISKSKTNFMVITALPKNFIWDGKSQPTDQGTEGMEPDRNHMVIVIKGWQYQINLS